MSSRRLPVLIRQQCWHTACSGGGFDARVWTDQMALRCLLTSCGSSIEARPQVWLGLSSKVLRLHAMTEGHVEGRQFGSAQVVSSRPQAGCSRPFGMGCSPLCAADTIKA